MKKEYKEILKSEKITGHTMSDKLRMSYGSYRSALSGFTIPRWVRSFLIGYKIGKK
jgi:hypothetical protein